MIQPRYEAFRQDSWQEVDWLTSSGSTFTQCQSAVGCGQPKGWQQQQEQALS